MFNKFFCIVRLKLREGSKKKIFTFSRPWLLRGGGSGDMSRPTKLFYGLKRGKKGTKMVLKSTKKVNWKSHGPTKSEYFFLLPSLNDWKPSLGFYQAFLRFLKTSLNQTFCIDLSTLQVAGKNPPFIYCYPNNAEHGWCEVDVRWAGLRKCGMTTLSRRPPPWEKNPSHFPLWWSGQDVPWPLWWDAPLWLLRPTLL